MKIDTIDWENWEPTDVATLCFIIKDEQILLIHKKRGLGAGKINGPGGRIEEGETLEQCAVREVQEELLVTPLKPSHRGTLHFQFTDGYALKCAVFSAHDYSGDATETDEALPKWVPINNIPYQDMWSDDQYWLPRMIAGDTFTGYFVFDNDTMLGHRLSFK